MIETRTQLYSFRILCAIDRLAKYFGVFMDKLGLEKEFKCPEKACARYARSILNNYRDVPYHKYVFKLHSSWM